MKALGSLLDSIALPVIAIVLVIALLWGWHLIG